MFDMHVLSRLEYTGYPLYIVKHKTCLRSDRNADLDNGAENLTASTTLRTDFGQSPPSETLGPCVSLACGCRT